MQYILIPRALQIDLDDIGWLNGYDDREQGGPSRTGISRRHVPEDYYALNEVGKRLNMRLNCSIVVGEWDPDNRLADVPYLSKYGKDWDNAAHNPEEEIRRHAEALNNCPYIDVAIHGLLHGYYRNDVDNTDCSDYYYKKDHKLYMVDEAEIRRRLDQFFGILKYYGVNKRVVSFIPPSGLYRWGDLTRILADYGVLYSGPVYRVMEYEGECPHIVGMENGIISYDRDHEFVRWYRLNERFGKYPLMKGVMGTHWPNFLHEDPAKNGERLEDAVAYFKACGAQFGTILSRGVDFYATQALYNRFAKCSEDATTLTVDITDVPEAKGKLDCFYLSAKEEITRHTGCEIEVYQRFDDHINYKVTPTAKVMTFQ